MGHVELDNLINRVERSGRVTKGEAQAIRYEVTMLRQSLKAAIDKIPGARPEASKFYVMDTEITYDEDSEGNEIEITALISHSETEGDTLNEALYNQAGGALPGFVYAVWENSGFRERTPDYFVVVTGYQDPLKVGLDQMPPVYL